MGGPVTEYTGSLPQREAALAKLETQQRRVQDQIDRFSARDRVDRDELHERAVRPH